MANAKRRRVFLVDDDEMQTQMLKDHMTDKLGVDITTFSTGEGMLERLGEAPDVIVLDYHLNTVNKSAKNGVDILKEIKQRSPETEVVMLSGQDKIDVAVDTMKYGAFDYVIKGDTAFVRTEKIAMNIFKNYRLQENLASYKKATRFLVIGIVLIVIVAVVFSAMGMLKFHTL